MILYSAEEQETICIYDYDENTWSVYTCVAKHITKMNKVAGEPDWTELSKDGKDRVVAAKWEGLTASQVSFRKENKRTMSLEQKEKARERLKKAREQKSAN